MRQAYTKFAFSTQGTNHIKSRKLCQDASLCFADDRFYIIAVADGHGSDNYPRTDRGSRYAVESAVEEIICFMSTVIDGNIDITVNSEEKLEQLAKRVLMRWYDSVGKDIKEYPILNDELKNVSDKYLNKYMSGKSLEKAYGSTLIVACVTDNYWFGLQIGDGKCVSFSEDGLSEEPIPWDEDCQFNVTTSICDEDALESFRYYFSTSVPIAVFIGTDGVDGYYVNAEELHAFYSDIISIFAEYGKNKGLNEVEEYLPVISARGTGDDVSIAGLIRTDISCNTIKLINSQVEYASAKINYMQLEKDYSMAKDQLEYIAIAFRNAKRSCETIEVRYKAAQSNIEKLKQERESAKKKLDMAEQSLEDLKKEVSESPSASYEVRSEPGDDLVETNNTTVQINEVNEIEDVSEKTLVETNESNLDGENLIIIKTEENIC